MMSIATRFAELSTTVQQIISEKDAESKNKPSSTIESARSLLIAIENAKNIYTEYPPVSPTADEKVEEFKRMIACLKKVDYCRLNLDAQIQHSINSGTSSGWIPKLHAVTPKYIVPIQSFHLQFFGKFKYADQSVYWDKYKPTLSLCGQSFEATSATHHAITFNTMFKNAIPICEENKCTQLIGRLTVPYESGYVIGSIKTFEFDVVIRVLPKVIGKLNINYLTKSKETSLIHQPFLWEKPIALGNVSNIELKLTAFDGHEYELKGEGQIPYLKLSPQAHGWQITPVPPDGL